MSWVPSNDFENEVVSQQPDHNFIFGKLTDSDSDEYYPRPESHLIFAQNKRERQITSSFNPKLDIIAKVQRIARTKPLGHQPTVDDWNDTDNIEQETIAMMRHLGINASIDQPLDENCTMATLPITEEMHVMHNGRKRMPIFFHDKYFKLKPRISSSPPSRDSTCSPDEYNSVTSSTQNQSFNSSSISVSGNESLQVEKSLFTSADENSFNTSNYKAVESEEESFKTATSGDIVQSSSRVRNSNRKTKNKKANYHVMENWRIRESPSENNRCLENWRVRSSARSFYNNQSSSSTNDSMSDYPPLPTKPSRGKQAKPDRFYTAKQLYEKNRSNN